MSSVFEKYRPKVYPFTFDCTLRVHRLAGGIPTDPKVAEGWLRAKCGVDKDQSVREAVAEVMVERGVSLDEATAEVNAHKHLTGFKRDPANGGQLYIEGRQVKSMLKEAANVRWAKDKWGPTRKGTKSYFAEHLFVLEDRIYLGVTEPSDINQRFVHTFRGSGIHYEEIVDAVEINFTLTTDVDFTKDQWGALWVTGEFQGLGSSRSQGFGCYEVIRWAKV